MHHVGNVSYSSTYYCPTMSNPCHSGTSVTWGSAYPVASVVSYSTPWTSVGHCGPVPHSSSSYHHSSQSSSYTSSSSSRSHVGWGYGGYSSSSSNYSHSQQQSSSTSYSSSVRPGLC